MIDWLATAFSSGFLVFLLMDRRIRSRDERIREIEKRQAEGGRE